ncbi:uncharacterized protein ACR2FA_010038 [Aphomia sociella]
MDNKKNEEINRIIDKLTDFVNGILTEFEDFDVRLVKLELEGHSEDEEEDKDVQIQVTVNNCAEEDKSIAQDTEEIDKEIKSVPERSDSTSQNKENDNETGSKNKSDDDSVTEKSTDTTNKGNKSNNENDTSSSNNQRSVNADNDKNPSDTPNVNESSFNDVYEKKTPQFKTLNLQKNGIDLLEALEKKGKKINPLLLYYVQEGDCRTDLIFL